MDYLLIIYLGEPYKRKAFKPEASGLASLQWDSAELLQVGVLDRLSYDDAFTIEEVVKRAYTYMYIYVCMYNVRNWAWENYMK